MFANGFGFGMMQPYFGPWFALIIGALAIWSLVWKGFALWYAARNNQKVWYVILVVVNTLGILEIVYLLFFRSDRTISGDSDDLSGNTTIIEEVVVAE